jgi:hypothetical protein
VLAYLQVATTGGKRWRLKYRFGGKEKVLSLGTYPDVSLSEARAKRHEVRNQLAHGIDPGSYAMVLPPEELSEILQLICAELLTVCTGEVRAHTGTDYKVVAIMQATTVNVRS